MSGRAERCDDALLLMSPQGGRCVEDVLPQEPGVPEGGWAGGVVCGGTGGGPTRAGGPTGVELVMSCALSVPPEVVLRRKLRCGPGLVMLLVIGVMLPDPCKGVCGKGVETGSRMDKGFLDGKEAADDRVGVLL